MLIKHVNLNIYHVMICMIVINVMYSAKERGHEEVQKKMILFSDRIKPHYSFFFAGSLA